MGGERTCKRKQMERRRMKTRHRRDDIPGCDESVFSCCEENVYEEPQENWLDDYLEIDVSASVTDLREQKKKEKEEEEVVVESLRHRRHHHSKKHRRHSRHSRSKSSKTTPSYVPPPYAPPPRDYDDDSFEERFAYIPAEQYPSRYVPDSPLPDRFVPRDAYEPTQRSHSVSHRSVASSRRSRSRHSSTRSRERDIQVSQYGSQGHGTTLPRSRSRRSRSTHSRSTVSYAPSIASSNGSGWAVGNFGNLPNVGDFMDAKTAAKVFAFAQKTLEVVARIGMKYPRIFAVFLLLLLVYLLYRQMELSLVYLIEIALRIVWPYAHYLFVMGETFFKSMGRWAHSADNIGQAMFCDIANSFCQRFKSMCDVSCSHVKTAVDRLRYDHQ